MTTNKWFILLLRLVNVASLIMANMLLLTYVRGIALAVLLVGVAVAYIGLSMLTGLIKLK